MEDKGFFFGYKVDFSDGEKQSEKEKKFRPPFLTQSHGIFLLLEKGKPASKSITKIRKERLNENEFLLFIKKL